MPRTIPPISLNAILASQTTEVIVALITLQLAETGETVCMTNNSTPITNSTARYNAFPLDITFPSNTEGQMSRATLTVDNVTQRLICGLRNLYEPMTMRLQLVRAAEPDEIIGEWSNFSSRKAVYDMQRITVIFTPEDLLLEPYPEGIFNPAGFPGLF